MNQTSIFCILLFSMTLSLNAQSIQTVSLELGQSNIIGDIESRYLSGKATTINYEYQFANNLYLGSNYSYRVSKGLGHQPIPQFVGWFPSYRTQTHNVNLKVGCHTESWKGFSLQIGVGFGLLTSSTSLDLLDASNNRYQDVVEQSGYNEGAEDYLVNVIDVYDGEYETDGPTQVGLFSSEQKGYLPKWFLRVEII